MIYNFETVLDKYIFYKDFHGRGSQGTAQVLPVKN